MLYKTLNPHGGDIYEKEIKLDFSANLNPLGMPKSAREAAKAAVDFSVNYPDPFCRRLVSALSASEGVAADCILCGNGASELIYAYCSAVKAEKALVTAPSYADYTVALSAAGTKVVRYTLDEDSSFEVNRVIIDAIEKEEAKLVFLCNPNNPTGLLTDEGVLMAILDYCKENDIRLFVDECFLDLTDGMSLKQHIKTCSNLFILKAFTKTYAMPGLRLGYCMTSDQQILQAMSYMTQAWNVSVPAQAAGIAALAEKSYLKDAKDLIKEERSYLSNMLVLTGFKVYSSDANYILFKAGEGLDQKLLKKGILIRNCDNYPGLDRGFYRVAVKTRFENEELIKAIKEVL